jgi:GTPase
VKRLKLALVGRPNVGKSALFNRICQKRLAIVDDVEGITRDRLYADADLFGKPFQVIDTGGLNPHSDIPFQEEIRRQAEIAMEEADAIVMVVDAQVGVTPLDEVVARLLRRTGKPLVLAVNKADGSFQAEMGFYSLGITRMVPVSAIHDFQIAELLEAAFTGMTFPPMTGDAERTKVAILGRPNVGKSTLVNFLLGEERCVVSPIAGTTRDSVDADIDAEDAHFTLIDTAGIRRKKAEHETVDKFAAIRTERAIERADICVLMLDAQEGVTAQEKRIARSIEDQGKGCLILLNKWDLVKGYRMEHCLKGLNEEASFISHCPTLFISAKAGRNLKPLFVHLKEIQEQQSQRIGTGQLNKFIEQAVQKCHPPMIQGRRMRIYYMAQVGTCPPHFVIFVNNPDLMTEAYKKYLINQFRETYGFKGAPLLFTLRGKKDRQQEEPE